MKRLLWGSLLAFVLMIGTLQAQTVTATLSWNMTQNTVADSQSFGYTLKDGTAAAVPVTGVACALVSGITQCHATITAPAPGPHSMVLTASSPLGTAASDPVTGATPGKPTTVTVTINITVP